MPRIRAENIEAHKLKTRREILEATRGLLAEIGSADISLGEVAHEAGIGRTTLYEYFRDKDDLIASLVEEHLPGVVDDLIGRLHATEGTERLVALAKATVNFVVSDPVLGLILHRELPRLSSEAQDRIRAAHSELAMDMVGAYRVSVERGELRPMAPDIVGRFMQDTIMSAARVLINAEDPEARYPEVAVELERFLIGGLRVD
jgi:AcrR family transcriptional regulator